LRKSEKYVNQAEIDNSDLVIIDGMFRRLCAEFVTEKISSESSKTIMVIFDNSDWYPKTIRSFGQKNKSWFQVDFSGFGPINEYTWTTSVFLNPAADSDFLRAKKISSRGFINQVASDDENF